MELRERRGALETLDAALEIARCQPLSELARAWAPGFAIAWLSLALYYVERVEGVRSLRPVFAVAFTLAFMVRALVLGRWAGRRASAELAIAGVPQTPARAALLMRASLWVGLDLWLWLWPLVLALHVEPWFVGAFLPILCVRGAMAPSWLAHVNASSERTGLSALLAAIKHAEGLRGRAVICELLLLLGALALAFNLGALLALLVNLGQSALGLDLAFVRAFLSPRNHFAMLSVAALSLALFEPARAALSAVLYVDAELTRGGAGVRALVARAIASPARRGRMMVGLCLLLWTSALPVRAQEEVPADPEIAETCDEACTRARATDERSAAAARRILHEPAFAEFPDETWSVDELGRSTVENWFERLLRWLLSRGDQDARPPGLKPPTLNLPQAGFFLALAVLLLALGVWHLMRRSALQRAGSEAAPVADLETAELQGSPEHFFAEASRLFQRDPRAAVRALYLGTLLGLSQRKLLVLKPEHTNGQYLRQLAERTEHAAFARLTRIFDGAQYGDLQVDVQEFERCQRLARELWRGETP